MCYEILEKSTALGDFSEQSTEYSVPTKKAGKFLTTS